MKSQTIWESASRPLFVRSVWLETSKSGRGLQRHFILDYETKQKSTKPKSAATPQRHKQERGTLQHSYSYDFTGDWRHLHADWLKHATSNLLLVNSAKVKLQPAGANQQQLQTQQQQHKLPPKSGRTTKRATFLPRSHRSHRYHPNGALHDIYELYSRRSSLQELQSTLSQANSNADERLAERVLNWLDLAGKHDSTVLQPQPLEMDSVQQQKKAHRPCTTSQATSGKQKSLTGAAPQLQRLSRHSKRNASTAKTARVATSATAGPCHHRDAVKHITIIFNRDGVPVRFNRPARNIDLCALSNSPSTTRRLAGTLASARLYSDSNRTCASCNKSNSCRTVLENGKTTRSAEVEHNVKGTQKRTHDDHQHRAGSNTYDAKKQLHIFMPSLPKKGLLPPTAINGAGSVCASVDADTISGLSNTFSELCKI